MSNKLFQGFISQMRDSVDRIVGVLDENGTVVACTVNDKIGTDLSVVADEMSYSFEPYISDGYTYKPKGTHARIEFIVFVSGEDAQALSIASIVVSALSNMKELYDEKYDKANFVKNMLLENFLVGDVYTKSKELRFDTEAERVVYLVRFESQNYVVPFDIVKNLVPDRVHDYVISISDEEVVVVKELRSAQDKRNIMKFAEMIIDTAQSEFLLKPVVGIGTIAKNVKELPLAYQNAKTALDIGTIFEPQKSVLNYENLGIGRLLYQLPVTLCDMFLKEVFKSGSLASLDQEILNTILAFFDNNLNVSETSRKLFIHRNTLVYRLDKIKKLTGLDLREFDNAITFKVALMVDKYVNSNPEMF